MTRGTKKNLTKCLSVLAVPFAAVSVFASQSLNFQPVRTVASGSWEKIECYQDEDPSFQQESYLEKTKHRNPEIAAAFGSGAPHSSTFLLHYGKGWDSGKGKVVVLLHGANDDATRSWVMPSMLHGDDSKKGLLPALEGRGYRVFAVTFPHKHGNLFYQAEHLADAITIVKRQTGVKKVTIIGHSAGGLVARMYVSGYRLNDHFTAYRGDVKKIITLAAPHLGEDFMFRHPEFNFFLCDSADPSKNAPMSWTRMLLYGEWKDSFDLSLYSDSFPMQQQLLWDWRDTYAPSAFSPDWYTTFSGGQGFMSQSLGFDDAVKKGGYFFEGFRKHPVASGVSVTVVAGTKTDIEAMAKTETDGPSDGLIFLKSATYTRDMAGPGRKEPIKVLQLPLDHKRISYNPQAIPLILSEL